AAEAGDPEAVDHVGASHLNIHGPPHRHMDLGGRTECAAFSARIPHLPPPLGSDHLNREHAPRGRKRQDGIACPPAIEQQDQEDEGRENEPASDQEPEAQSLRCCSRWPEGSVKRKGDDTSEDHKAPAKHYPPDLCDLLGRGTRRLKCRHRAVGPAGSRQQAKGHWGDVTMSMEEIAKPPGTGTTTVVAVAGHPLHPMLVTFPIAFLLGAFASDLAFWLLRDPFWARMSVWLIGGGAAMGSLAGLSGTVELLSIAGIRRRAAAWNHFIA